jgi:hypothetical protein
MTENKLIYFNSGKIRELIICDKWKNWAASPIVMWPEFVRSRVSRLDTPWPLTDSSVSQFPAPNTPKLSFTDAFDSIAIEVCNKIETTGKKLYVSWSGGIDSTSIMIAILKHASKNVLNNTVVLLNDHSIEENRHLYAKHILPNVHVENIINFTVTEENYKNLIFLDGEAGNQIMGSYQINNLVVSKKFDLLDSPIHSVSPNEIDFTDEFWYNTILDTAKLAPCSINTVYDFLWWINFNFKWDDVLLRKLSSITGPLTPLQTQDFYYNSLFRFYEHPLVQNWAINSLDQRREDARIMTKLAAKKYIYEYDKNDLYFSNCRETPSSPKKMTDSVFAIDQNWNKLRFSNPEHRKQLASWITI